MRKILTVLLLTFCLLSVNAQKKVVRRSSKCVSTVKVVPSQKAKAIHKKETLNYTPGRVVDLGLPSGTLWADKNLGASSETDEGGLYVWGDPTESDQTSNVPKYISEISHTEYDIATIKWGVCWCMPTTEQFMELHDNCTIKKSKKFGIEGYIVTGPNGNTLFFPFSSLYKEKFGGWNYHMSWTANKDSEQRALACNLINGFFYWNPMAKATIRPVKKNK